jgi:hypothetical protein
MDADIVAALQCDIPLSILTDPPYNLVLGDLIQATVAAGNAQGYGEASQVNIEGGTVQTEPVKTQGLVFESGSSTTTAITISWTEPSGDSQTGGSPILSYYIDGAESAESPSWSRLGEVAVGTNQFTADSSIIGGTTYVFRVYSVNLHGEGEASDTLSALAAYIPDQPDAPTTTQVATGVLVAWTEPNDNHLPVLEYEVSVADANGAL